ncbi:excinuclease ABC subunit UvrC [Kiritimatiella glycovorans]|uniref:Excinuclease ABC subunit C n=1 Tax=Kiritimatiella glycovorans TaxID=1307763 RepID=A0A0G3EB52_9BACT|nr:excinuclease ABC subunit UvrC [Kiritimatiella glycovorans]AKJ63726.1 Excinuclease ABC subunit C [Kiritimatiella glycovorans]
MNWPESIRRKLDALPDRPGVYLMRDRRGKIIYVGKAASLRKRVRSYFRPSTMRRGDPKLRGLIRSIADFDVLELRTEAEATLTEGNLIKEYRPRYNALFKDDKRFLLLRVHPGEPYPRFDTCRIRRDDGARYFGPYASSSAAYAAKEFLEARFGLRLCRPRVPDRETYRHCHNDVIRRCSAPCIGRITPEEYQRRVEESCAFLRGERPELLRELRAQMEAAAEGQHYESAAALRDLLKLVTRAVRERARVRRTPALQEETARQGLRELAVALKLPHPPDVIECFDISNISGTYAVAALVAAVDGRPVPQRYRRFRIRTVEGADDPRMMAEAVRRRYSRLAREGSSMPGLVLVDGGITQLRAARRALHELDLGGLVVAGLAKRYEELYTNAESAAETVRLPGDSAALEVIRRIRDEAHRFAIAYHRRLRGRRIRESVLDDIEGIGPRKKEQLLRHFGSFQRLKKADEKELADAPGIGPHTAKLIRTELERLSRNP